MGLAETITKLGPGLIEGSTCSRLPLTHLHHVPDCLQSQITETEQIASIAIQVLDQKAVCQQDPDQDAADEAPEDSAEYDSILISSAGDLAAALATVLGADFAQAFPTFFNLIARYYVSYVFLLSKSSLLNSVC